MRERTRAVSLLVVCCAATFALKLWANAARVEAGHGDTNYYFHVAQNLFAGRGFVCDYVWSYLENPTGRIPAPSHVWWMPGPTLISWLGMVIAGEATYAAAKTAMAAVTSLYPVVVWWTAWVVARDRAIAARAAVLSVAFHLFLDQPCAPLSHGPYGLAVGAALALLASAPLTTKRGIALGALIGAGHYFRGDALTLFGTAGVLALVSVRRAGLRAAGLPLLAALAAYVAVLSPWFARNVIVFGAPLPPGPSKALYLRDYYDWFALPDRLTATQFLKDGWGPVLADKVEETGDAVRSFAVSYFDPTLAELPNVDHSLTSTLGSLFRWIGDEHAQFRASEPPPWLFLRQLSIAMAVLTFLGLARLALRTWGTSRRWLGVYALHSAGEIVFYAWLFTGVANQSYVSSLYALYPLFVVGIAVSVEWPAALARRAPRAASTFAWGAIALLFAGNALGGGAYLRSYKGPDISQKFALLQEFGRKLIEKGFDPEKDVLMAANPWDHYAALPMRVVRTPDEPYARVLATMNRLGVTWVVASDRPFYTQGMRPYRLALYWLLEDRDLFWPAYRDNEMRLTALKVHPKLLKSTPESRRVTTAPK